MKPGDKIKYRNRIGFILYKWKNNRFDIIVGKGYNLYKNVRRTSITKL